MGIDIVCWKNCELQRTMDVEQFLALVKLTAYKATAERMAPDRLDRLKIKVQRGDEPSRTMTYREICDAIDDAAKAAPGCADCLRSGGREDGSYHYLSYPIDDVLESMLFDYFVEETPVDGSPCNQIYRDVIATLPSSGSTWHDRRGSQEVGDLAMLPEPLVHRFPAAINGHDYLDSAQVFDALFRTLDGIAPVMAYGMLWNRFAEFVDRLQLPEEEMSDSLQEALGLADFFKLAMAHGLAAGCSVLVFP